MKKKFCILMAAVAALSVTAFAACTPEASAEAVNLVDIKATEVGLRNDVDYYVVPEPAASLKVKTMDGLDFSGNLQELYGGNGYPQAVVVAKNQIVSTAFCTRFINALEANPEWLLAETTSAETVVSAVQAHLAPEMTPTFNAKNLTKSVIKNCNISLTPAKDCKAQVNGFMTELNALGTNFGTPADKFFYNGEASETAYDGNIAVYAPDGAPALGLANLLAGEVDLGDNVSYNIVDASTIQTFVSGGSPKADICVLPVNLAVKLLGNGENYTMLGTLTHGNLFILSKNGKEITSANVSELGGKTVGVINLAAVPGLTLKLILDKNNLEYNELT